MPNTYADASMLSVIIPTLNAAECLTETVGALRHGSGSLVGEIVVADGGSTDGTPALAREMGANVISTACGRGGQLAAGANASSGDWLLFLHADTALAAGWAEEVALFINDETPDNPHVGVFRFALDDDRAAARRVECAVAWRCRWLGLPYGDQGLLISAALYRALGGYRSLPLMEDVDFIRRIGRHIGRGRILRFKTAAVTSAARYRRSGYIRRPLRNLMCLMLYYLKVPVPWIAKLYG